MQLSELIKEYRETVARVGSVRGAARELGVPESSLRRWLAGGTPKIAKDEEPEGVPGHAYVPDASEFPASHIEEGGVETRDFWAQHEGVRRYIITSAQNNADVHTEFLDNLKALAAYVDAEIIVGYSVYDRAGYRGIVAKGKGEAKKQGIWWDRAVKPYALNTRARLAKRLAFCGEFDVLATAVDPLSGLDSYCGRSSILVPHNKFAFRCVESRKHQMPKEMMTTGSVTKPRFIQRKTGQKAHFHHVIGALLVEVTGAGYWYIHHLNAEEDGSFYWLDKRVEAGTVSDGPPIAGLILGDIHHEKIDGPAECTTMYDYSSPLAVLRPQQVVVHDLIDFTSRNHHNRDDPFFRIGQRSVTVEQEIGRAAQFLSRLDFRTPGTVNVVAANHNDAYVKWIKETNWKTDPDNAVFYLKSALTLATAASDGGRVDLLRWAIQEHFGKATKVRFHRPDDSLEIAGVECGLHGHIGPSGSRGNPRAFSRLGFKTFTGHTHTPSIVDGCYTVGVMGKLDMGYNVGPSKWMHASGIVYPNGKRAFIFIKNRGWRAPLQEDRTM